MTTQTWHADDDLLAAYVAGRLDAISAPPWSSTSPAAPSAAARSRRSSRCGRSTGLGRRPRRGRSPGAAAADPARPPAAACRSRPRCCWRRPRRCAPPGWSAPSSRSRSPSPPTALTGGTLLAPFLLVAPLVPVIGVAAAYGSQEDPLEALVVTAPYGRTRLILLRTLAVLATVLPFAALARAVAARARRGWRAPGSARRSR